MKRASGTFSRKKAAVLLDFVQMRGGGGALPKFFVTFSLVHFWSIKRVYFLQNTNNLNFNLFLDCIYDPKRASILPSFKKNFGKWLILNIA